jgi:hypothetical protein
MTRMVPAFIKTLFPDIYITPQDFRRMIPSALYAHNIHQEGKTLEHTLVSLAQLVNTSQDVRTSFH